MTKPAGTVIILGAGPAGLTTGFALACAGWSVQVFDQAPVVGGLARTEERSGFRFDIGGHRWFTKKDELNQFLVDLLQDELVWVNRISKIYFDGKMVDYPLRASNVLTSIGPGTSVRAVGDFVLSQASQIMSKKPVVSMEDAYVAQFGRTLYEMFFKRYSEKVWGKECTELSGDWVAQRSKGLSLFTAIRDAVKRTDGKVESLVEHFMYPRLGFGRISERMAEEIEQRGGSVNLGQRAIAVQHDRQRITGVTLSDGRTEHQITGDVFVSSIPMTELTQILRPEAESGILNASHELSYRDVITVHIMLNRPQVTDDTWIYVHDRNVTFARLHEPRNWSVEMAPEGKTSLVLEYFCEVGDPLWNRSDDEICALAVHELSEQLHFIEKRDVIDSFAIRNVDAYPRYNLKYRDAVESIKNHLRSFSNLSIVGRGGTFRYNNTDHAIETGLLAARFILGDAVDPDSVNTEQEYLEERRVSSASIA
ncbi:MAG: FAD-dependent oxidoreductase [Chloroflexota bacterium]